MRRSTHHVNDDTMKEVRKPMGAPAEDSKASERPTRNRRFRDRNLPAGRMTLDKETVKKKQEFPGKK